MTTKEKQTDFSSKSSFEYAMLNYALVEIKSRPLRTLGVVAGFAFGVALFSVCSALVKSNNDQMWRTLSGTGTHFIAYKPLCCEVPYIDDRENQGFFVDGTPSNPFRKTLESRINNLDSVMDAAAAIQFRIKYDNNSYLSIFGVPLRSLRSIKTNSCSASDIVAGRYLEKEDKQAVLLDASFAKIHHIVPGNTITLPDRVYDVVGIVNTGVKPVKADIYMPYHVAEKAIDHYTRFSMKGLANIILVESKNALTHTESVTDVEKILGDKGLTESYNCHKPSAAVITTNNRLMSFLMAGNILFLVLYAFRTLLSAINERRKTFGILYSLGWSRKRLMALTMLEGCLQTIVGSIVGLIIAFVTLAALPSTVTLPQFHVADSTFSNGIIVRSIIITLVAAIVAGTMPGFTFLRKNPIQIIRGS